MTSSIERERGFAARDENGSGARVGGFFSKRESLIEVGFVVVGVLVAVTLAVLVGGRSMGGAKRSQRHHASPPDPGSVPPSRHKATSAAATRKARLPRSMRASVPIS